MAEYLPMTGESAADRSLLEAHRRGAGLRDQDGTTFWHAWLTHPISGEEALVIQNEADKEYLSANELAALLTEAEAAADDWFLTFEPEEA